MILTADQEEAVLTCVNDLQHYYALCGNVLDFQNLEILKIYINSLHANLKNIEVVAEIVSVSDSKK